MNDDPKFLIIAVAILALLAGSVAMLALTALITPMARRTLAAREQEQPEGGGA